MNDLTKFSSVDAAFFRVISSFLGSDVRWTCMF